MRWNRDMSIGWGTFEDVWWSAILCPSAIKQQELVIEMNSLEKLKIIKKGLTGYSSPVFWLKERTKTCAEYYRFSSSQWQIWQN